MNSANLEQRVAALEVRLAELLELVQSRPTRQRWRSVVGMFRDDPEIIELHREARRIRDEDRAATRDRSESRPD